MKPNLIAAIVIALIIFGAVLFVVEAGYNWLHVLLGFVVASLIGAGALLSRNAFMIFSLVSVALLAAYLGWKFEWLGLVPGIFGGMAIGCVFQWAWFKPYAKHYSQQRSKLAEALEREPTSGPE